MFLGNESKQALPPSLQQHIKKEEIHIAVELSSTGDVLFEIPALHFCSLASLINKN